MKEALHGIRGSNSDKMRAADQPILSPAFRVSNELKGEHDDGESKERQDESV